nr:MAG TPA: Endonuclease [Caudoviricetes sp.]
MRGRLRLLLEHYRRHDLHADRRGADRERGNRAAEMQILRLLIPKNSAVWRTAVPLVPEVAKHRPGHRFLQLCRETRRSRRMSGLRFESMADMPPRMRELYAKQRLPEAQQEQKRKAKYKNAPEKRAGVRFDSKKEARRYDELLTMLRAGLISDLRLQPQFTLQESYCTETGERVRAVRYTADFSYRAGGKLIVEDVKSTATRTKEYLRNKKFMRSKFGIDIQEV